MRIVLIDDDGMVLETITLGWPEQSDQFETFTSFETLKPYLYSRDFLDTDCVILDLQLPDASGSQVVSEIRRLSDVPIIMLSGWGDTDFRADLINKGIDDYVLKPASAKELHARANRIVNRNTQPVTAPPMEPVEIGNILYTPLRQILTCGGLEVELTHAEGKLLDALLTAQGRPVSRNDLYHQAFGRAHKEGEKVLETYISRLRQKMESLDPGSGNLLQTARGLGYRLAARRP